MCAKLSLKDLNPDSYPSLPMSTYICRMIIAPKVRCGRKTRG